MSTLLQALDQLKDKGFSPTERAFVAHEWIKWSVYFFGSKPDGHFSLHHQRCQKFFELFQKTIVDLQLPEQLYKNSDCSYVMSLRNNCFKVFGLSPGDFDGIVQLTQNHIHELSSARFSNATLDDWLDALSAYSTFKWRKINEISWDEQRLQEFLDDKMPYSKSAPQKNENSSQSLRQAHIKLENALHHANIPVCSLDEFTVHSIASCDRLSSSLEKMCQAYEYVGGPPPGLGAIHLRVTHQCIAESDGYAIIPLSGPTMPVKTPVVCISNRPFVEMDEILVHEMFHAHDFLLNDVVQKMAGDHMLSECADNDHKLLHALKNVCIDIENLKCNDGNHESDRNMARQCLVNHFLFEGIKHNELTEFIHTWEQSTKKRQRQNFVEGCITNVVASGSK